jgi:hypothetical protein
MADQPRRSQRVATQITKTDLNISTHIDQSLNMATPASASVTVCNENTTPDHDQVSKNNVNELITAQLVAALQSPEVIASNRSLVEMAVKMTLDDHYKKHYKPLADKCKDLQIRVSELEK